MQIKEILAIEEKNKSDIHLHKDGLFWRAYDVSAYQFVKYFRQFKLTKKRMKTVQKELVYLGFPESTFVVLIEEAERSSYDIRRSEQHIAIMGLPAIMGNDYEEWFDALSVTTKKQKEHFGKNLQEEIIEKVRSYPILEKSPLETQAFVLALQKTINGIT